MGASTKGRRLAIDTSCADNSLFTGEISPGELTSRTFILSFINRAAEIWLLRKNSNILSDLDTARDLTLDPVSTVNVVGGERFAPRPEVL